MQQKVAPTPNFSYGSSASSMGSRQASSMQQLAIDSGLLEATGDSFGGWFVYVDGERVEAHGQWFCPLCWKHLNEYTLMQHVESKDHIKRSEWQQWSSVASSSNGGTVVKKIEEDPHPLALSKAEYVDPREEFLAWVPPDPSRPDERCLRCLLCQKWVQDDWSHSLKEGSKDHRRHMENHYHFRSDWYVDNVVKLKKKYSIGNSDQQTYSSAPSNVSKPLTGQPMAGTNGSESNWHTPGRANRPPKPQVPAPWMVGWSEEHQRYYYYNSQTSQSKWEAPLDPLPF